MSNYTSLDDIKVKEKVTIIKIHTKEKLLHKLLDMGFVSGASIEILRKAPLGDPLELRIQGYTLFLRRSEARLIEVQKL